MWYALDLNIVSYPFPMFCYYLLLKIAMMKVFMQMSFLMYLSGEDDCKRLLQGAIPTLNLPTTKEPKNGTGR